jgi:hypothetical protein
VSNKNAKKLRKSIKKEAQKYGEQMVTQEMEKNVKLLINCNKVLLKQKRKMIAIIIILLVYGLSLTVYVAEKIFNFFPYGRF